MGYVQDLGDRAVSHAFIDLSLGVMGGHQPRGCRATPERHGRQARSQGCADASTPIRLRHADSATSVSPSRIGEQVPAPTTEPDRRSRAMTASAPPAMAARCRATSVRDGGRGSSYAAAWTTIILNKSSSVWGTASSTPWTCSAPSTAGRARRREEPQVPRARRIHAVSRSDSARSKSPNGWNPMRRQ